MPRPIDGHLCARLAREHGTPYYLYDAAVIRAQIAKLRPFDVIRYAQKALSNVHVLRLMKAEGVLVDAVSGGELERALRAGYTGAGEPAGVVFTADVIDEPTLERVVALDVPVNAGSADMLEQLGRKHPGHRVWLRVNPGFGHGHSRKTNTGGEQSKHGIWHEDVQDCLRRADANGLAINGLHMHIGSGTDMEHLQHVCQAMEKTARDVGRSVTSISAGGGLPVPYRAEDSSIDLAAYFELWNATRKRLQDAFGHKVTLEIEPGRYLVAESGCLVTEIRAVKRMGGNTFYLLDAGFNNLARPILYGAYHPMSIVPKSGDGAERPLHDVVVGGPLCESGDIFTQQNGGIVCTRQLPAAEVGELLVIEIAGAYGYVMSSNYNSKPLAAEVLVQDGKAHLIRKRQTFEDIVRGEEIPAK
jgi:diaminopimelate decarboxylase